MKLCAHGQAYYCGDCKNETGRHPHQRRHDEDCAVCGKPATRGNEFASLCEDHDSSEIENPNDGCE